MQLKKILTLNLLLVVILASFAFAAEVDSIMSTRTSPSIGNYHVQYLKTNINKDEALTRAYNALSELEFDKSIEILSAHIGKYKPFTTSGKVSPNLNKETKNNLSEAYMFLGYCHLNKREPEKTIDSLKKSVLLNPANECAYFYLANEYLHIGDTYEMKTFLKKALDLNPKFISALRLLAETYKDEGDMKQAIYYYNYIVQILPNSAYYRYQYYRALMGSGDYKGAEEQIKKLMEMEPNFKVNHQRLAEIYKKEKRYEEAIAEYNVLIADERYQQIAYVGKAGVYAESGKLSEAKKYLGMANKMGKHLAEANEVAYTIEMKDKERSKDTIKYIILISAVTVLIYLIFTSNKSSTRRKYIQSIVSHFNESLERIYDVRELGVFLPEFFSQRLEMKKSMLLLYNRQNNSLTPVDSQKNSLTPSIKIVTGNEVTNWILQESKPIMTIKDIERSKLFEEAFPSLAKRLKEMDMTHIITLKEKNACVGFLVLGEPINPNINIPAQTDLLEPLIVIAAQSLQTLHLFETSIVDELTGLYNKRYFFQTLTAELKRGDRYKQPCSLCTFDIDDFKKLNDTYGHAQGDQVLKEIGIIIKDSIREGIDTGIRAGGEEFQIILPATTTELAFMVAERIRQTIQDHSFKGFDQAKQITVSIGISTYPDFARTDNELIKSSDKALYLAKRTGKNKVCQASELNTSGGRRSFKSEMILENRFDHLNIKDEVTGLFNFSYFSMRIKEELKRADRYKLACSLILFTPYPEVKEENLEEIMQALATIMKVQHREGIDTPTKLNDKTAMMIAPETTLEEACNVARRIKKYFDAKKLLSNGMEIQLLAGISSYPDCSENASELMETANSALTSAKNTLSKVIKAPMVENSGFQCKPPEISGESITPA